MATNRGYEQGSPFGRVLDWPTFTLAVVGLIVVLVLAAAALYPIAVVSLKYWGAM